MSSAALWYRIAHETDQKIVERFGRTKQEVFFGSLQLQDEIGRDEVEKVPASGLGVYTYFMRISQGLRQLMAGARKFNPFSAGARTCGQAR